MKYLVFLFVLAISLSAQIKIKSLENVNVIVKNVDDVKYLLKESSIFLKGNIVLSQGDITFKADEVIFNTATYDYIARGNINILSKENEISGKESYGNFKDGVYNVAKLNVKKGAWYNSAKLLLSNDSLSSVAYDVTMTTCGLKDPCYILKAKKVLYHLDGTYDVYDAHLYFQDVPIMYFPYYRKILGGDGVFEIRPGYRSSWGPQLYISRRWNFSNNNYSTLMFDYRKEKGWAFGNETVYNSDDSKTRLLLYGLKDKDKPFTSGDNYGRFNSEESRYEFLLNHKSKLSENLDLYINADKVSDLVFKRDFFKRDYFFYQQPYTQLYLNYYNDDYELSLNYRPKINDFYSVIERLPELNFLLNKQQLHENLYYTLNMNASYNRVSWLNPDVVTANVHQGYEAFRFDMLHLFNAYFNYKNWQFQPRFSARWVHYNKQSLSFSQNDLYNLILQDNAFNSPSAFNNYQVRNQAINRLIFELGFDLHTRYYKTFKNKDNKASFRHVLEPYLVYNYVPEIDEKRENILYFDHLDRISNNHFIRLGLLQRLQNVKDNKIRNFLSFNSYLDYHFSTANQEEGSDLGLDFFVNFSNNIDLKLRSLYDISENEMKSSNLSLNIKGEKTYFSVAYNNYNNHTSRDLYSNSNYLQNYFYASDYAKIYNKNETIRASIAQNLTSSIYARANTYYDIDKDEFILSQLYVKKRFHCISTSINIDKTPSDFSIGFFISLNAYDREYLGASNIDFAENF